MAHECTDAASPSPINSLNISIEITIFSIHGPIISICVWNNKINVDTWKEGIVCSILCSPCTYFCSDQRDPQKADPSEKQYFSNSKNPGYISLGKKLQIELWNICFETTCSKKNLGITERSGNFPFRVLSHDSSLHCASLDGRDSTNIKNRRKRRRRESWKGGLIYFEFACNIQCIMAIITFGIVSQERNAIQQSLVCCRTVFFSIFSSTMIHMDAPFCGCRV